MHDHLESSIRAFLLSLGISWTSISIQRRSNGSLSLRIRGLSLSELKSFSTDPHLILPRILGWLVDLPWFMEVQKRLSYLRDTSANDK